MPTELVNLELEEVSLVDLGDDPLAKVALFKRSPKGEDMEVEDIDKGITIEIEIKSPEEEMLEMKLEAQAEMSKAADCTDCADGSCPDCLAMQEADKSCGEKPMRKSWKAEAEALAEEVELLKAKVEGLEAEAFEKAKPKEEMIEVEGEMIAKSAIPAPILKKLEEMEKAAEGEAIRKRADEVLPNFKGTADQRGKLLKAVGEDADILELLRAADALFGEAFKEVGKTDAKSDLLTPKEKLDTMVKAYQEDKKVDFFKAYAAVTKTAEGKDLLLKSYNDK